MKRLIVAAVLAVGLHALLLRVPVPWTRPVLQLRPDRGIDIDLAMFPKPAAKQASPAPEKIPPLPRPKPVSKPKPRPKPVRVQKHEADTVMVPPPSRLMNTAPSVAPSPSVESPPVAPPETTTSTGTGLADPHSGDKPTRSAVQVSQPLYDINPPPDYPRVARRRHYQGLVLLDVRVSVDGRAADVKLARSSGYPVLDRSALSAVQLWRFEPARRDSVPVETWVQVPVRFELK